MAEALQAMTGKKLNICKHQGNEQVSGRSGAAIPQNSLFGTAHLLTLSLFSLSDAQGSRPSSVSAGSHRACMEACRLCRLATGEAAPTAVGLPCASVTAGHWQLRCLLWQHASNDWREMDPDWPGRVEWRSREC